MREPLYVLHALCQRCRRHVAYRVPGWVVEMYRAQEPDRFAGTYQCQRPDCRERGPDGRWRRTLIDLYAVSFQQAQPAEEGRRAA